MEKNTNTTSEEQPKLLSLQDQYNAQRKQKGSALTPEEVAALDSNEYDRQFWRHRFNPQAVVDEYENAYNTAAENELKSYKSNLGLSDRDENGMLVGEKSVYNMPTLNRGVSLRDKNTIRQYTAEGDDNKTMEALRSITGMAFDGYTSPANARISLLNKEKELYNEYLTTTDDARRQEIISEMEPINKQLDVIDDFMKIVGSKWDSENNKYGDVSAVTAEELLAPKATALTEDQMELKKQQNALKNRKIGRGIGDLVRSLGNSIQSITGAKVGDYNFNQPYQQLDTRGQQLYQTYIAKQEQIRREQAAAAQAAAQAQQKYNQSVALEDIKHQNKLAEDQANNEAKADVVDKQLAAKIKEAEIKRGASEKDAEKKAKAIATSGKYDKCFEVGGDLFLFNKNLGSSNLGFNILGWMQSQLAKKYTKVSNMAKVYTTGNSLQFQSEDPFATINKFLGSLDKNDSTDAAIIKDINTYLTNLNGVDKLSNLKDDNKDDKPGVVSGGTSRS